MNQSVNKNYFYLLQPRWIGWDYFYKVFIANEYLCFGKISSQFFKEEVLDDYTVAQAPFPLSIIAKLIKDKLIVKKIESEKGLNNLQPGSQEFLDLNKKNFVLHFKNIKKARLNSKRSWWTARHINFGSMTLYLNNGKKIKFIIVDQESLKFIKNYLRRLIVIN